MKTAMQELIEWYQKEHFVKTTFHIQLLNKFESLLEKEKDRMFHSFYAGVGYDELLDDCDKIFEQYYNEVFNQNK
jgi:hypothetical protein